MEDEFAIPARADELEGRGGRFGVAERVDVSAMPAAAVLAALEDARERAFDAAPEDALSERATLDTVYSALCGFGELPAAAVGSLRRTLAESTDRLVAVVRRVAKLDMARSDAELVGPRSALKLHAFFVSWLVTAALGREEDAPTRASTAKGARASTAKGGKAAAAGSWERAALLEDMLLRLNAALECELAALWGLSAPDESFMHLFTRAACALLEHPTLSKNAAIRRPAVEVLATAAARFGQRLAVVTSCVELVHKCEHVPPYLAELAVRLTAADDGVQVVGELVHDVGAAAAAAGAAGADSSGARGAAALMVELAERLPEVLLANVGALMPQLASDNYTVRSGVVQAFGGLLVHVQEQRRALLAQHADDALGELNGDALRQTAEAISDVLLARVLDASSYTRGRALQAWARAVQARAVPPSVWDALVDAVLGRLRDKAALVRKNALVTLRQLAQFNPFAPSLDTNAHAAAHATLKAKVEEVRAEAEGAAEPDPAAIADAAFWETDEPGAAGAAEGGGADGARARRALALCDGALRFSRALDGALDDVVQLLSSSTATDAAETISTLATLADFGVRRAPASLLGTLPLSLSPEPTVRAALAEAFLGTLLGGALGEEAEGEAHVAAAKGPKPRAPRAHAAAAASARSLVSLYAKLGPNSHAALEALLPQLLGDASAGGAAASAGAAGAKLPAGIVGALWELALEPPADAEPGAVRPEGAPPRTPRAAASLELLLMLAAVDADVLRGRIDRMLTLALSPPYNAQLASAACAVLGAAAGANAEAAGGASAVPIPRQRALQQLRALLAWAPAEGGADAAAWPQMAERALGALYALSPAPEAEAASVVRALHAHALGGADDDARSAAAPPGAEGEVDGVERGGSVDPPVSHATSVDALCRLLFTLGQIAISELVHIERCERALKRARAGARAPPAGAAAAGAEADGEDESAVEKELGARAEAEETDYENFRLLADRDVVGWRSGDGPDGPGPDGLLGAYCPLVDALCAGEGAGAQPRVRCAAALTLAKLMAASPAYCEARLQLFFSLLLAPDQHGGQHGGDAGSKDGGAACADEDGGSATCAPADGAHAAVPAAVRTTLVVALGDLCVRYPNLLEPWTAHVHRTLRDSDVCVRTHALMVVSHLTLHDMVKARGGIAESALLLLDPQPEVRARARALFTELAAKSSAPVYNALPDLLSRLSRPEAGVSSEGFKEILGYLLGFIDKDRQAEALSERLVARLAAADADVPETARAIAFCLERLPATERSLRRLLERQESYAHRLGDEIVFASLCEAAARARRVGKAALSQTAEEFEAVLGKLRARALRADGAASDDEAETPAREHAAAAATPARAANLEGVLSELPGGPTQTPASARGARSGSRGSRAGAGKAAGAKAQQPAAARSQRAARAV